MQRNGLLMTGLMATVLSSGAASAGEMVEPRPLKLDLELAADDWLLEEWAMAAAPRGQVGAARNRLARAVNRAGSGFRVGPVVPALCEDDLPGTSAVFDAYNRAMECDDDQIGLSVSIRNY